MQLRSVGAFPRDVAVPAAACEGADQHVAGLQPVASGAFTRRPHHPPASGAADQVAEAVHAHGPSVPRPRVGSS